MKKRFKKKKRKAAKFQNKKKIYNSAFTTQISYIYKHKLLTLVNVKIKVVLTVEFFYFVYFLMTNKKEGKKLNISLVWLSNKCVVDKTDALLLKNLSECLWSTSFEY